MQNNNHTAWIGFAGAILAAIIGGTFLLLSRIHNGDGTTATLISGSSFVPTTANDASKPQVGVADGTPFIVTLKPVGVGENGWDSESCSDEIIFRSSHDERRWAKVRLQGKEHFVSVSVGLGDDNQGLDIQEFSTSQISIGSRIFLKTAKYTVKATVVRAMVGNDPDPAKPYPSVFKELVLSVQVQEIHSKLNPRL